MINSATANETDTRILYRLYDLGMIFICNDGRIEDILLERRCAE